MRRQSNVPSSSTDLTVIPGVGKSIAMDLRELGIQTVGDLRNKRPEQLYQQHCELRGMHIDRCVLYAFRCAVYFASHTRHDPELLKWWNWKDTPKPKRKDHD